MHIVVSILFCPFLFFFFNDTATTEIYTLSLHDALPICRPPRRCSRPARSTNRTRVSGSADRKSTRLNSSHVSISYAVFCLQKKNIFARSTLVPLPLLRIAKLETYQQPS